MRSKTTKLPRQILSLVLALSLLSTTILGTLPQSAFAAANTDISGGSYFDFGATEYSAKETDKTLHIKVLRHGDSSGDVDVFFRAADFLSDYGKDYEILDEKGRALAKVYGEKPKVSDFVFDEDTDEPSTATPVADAAVVADAAAVDGAAEKPPTNAAEKVSTEPDPADDKVSAADEPDALALADAAATDAAAEKPPANAAENVSTEPDPADAKISAADEPDALALADAAATDAAAESPPAKAAENVNTRPDPTDDKVSAADELEAAKTNVADKANTATASGETLQSAVKNTAQQDLSPNENKKHSTGSPLLDAQAQYLQLPNDASKEKTEQAVKETLNDLYSYFLTAEGSSGTLHFKNGETEKTIVVKIYDNDAAESDKLFMLALMGTNTENTTIAANATTYVTITDDEEYEMPTFDLVDNMLTLSADTPAGYATVRRTGGTQYFSTVYVSTVKATAEEGAYEAFEGKTVAFIPGETEKSVKVTATDFSKPAKFGMRLEGDDTARIGNHYIDIIIQDMHTPPEANMSGIKPMAGIGLMASNVVLGSAQVMPPNQVEISGGWKKDVTGGDNDNTAKCANSDLYVAQYDKGKHSMLVTNKTVNLTGVKNIKFSMNVGGNGSDFTTYFETDSDQSWDGSLDQYKVNGKSDWAQRDLNVASRNGNVYVKFGAKANAAGKQNPKATVDWIRFDYAKYTFSPQNSAENFNRKIYDFTEGSPIIYDTFYDGETTRVYNPGAVTIQSGSNTVSGFYANNASAVTFAAANESSNAQKAIYLKGVYFASSNQSANSMYLNGTYTSKNVYYVAADATTHKVTVTPNQTFVKTLIDKGVISSKNADENIKVFPVFAQETVAVNFENADRNDSQSATQGKFDSTHLNSYITNILGSAAVKKCLHNNWLDYYNMTIPKYSIVRVQTVPVSNRTPAGVSWWYHDGSGSGVNYYKQGQTAFSGDKASGDIIAQTDYSKADIVALKSLSMKPATGVQTFYVGYSPKSYPYITGITESLENAVINTTDSGSGEKTDNTGKMWLNSPYIGKNYTLSALAPSDHYTYWANMSGDTNNDGTIGSGDAAMTARTERARSANPLYIYGSKLNITLDQDNTRYYYSFMPKTNQATVTQRGRVVRENNTLYNLVKKKAAAGYTPVAGAYMNVAGFTGMTDGNGDYAIPIYGLPDWGAISASLSADGVDYNAVACIEDNTTMILQALETFTAKSVSAGYAKKTGSTAENFVTVEDDTLTINAAVTSTSALTATGARFFIYDDEGYQKVDCSNREGYTTTTATSGNTLNATLKFNPKKDMAFGYKVYVQFCDQNEKWYQPIDMGYSFFAALDLGKFMFPMIGSSSLENIITTGFVADVIGNPLGDIDLGSISAFNVSSAAYTPKNIPEKDQQKYTWQKNAYAFGWSTSFDNGTAGRTWDSAKSHEAEMAEYLKKIKNNEITGAAPTASKYNTKGKFKWSVTPQVGFKLTLSARNDGNNYFEDLVFYVKVGFDVNAYNTVQLPVGISLFMSAGLQGDVTGIYHMYTDYQDSYETEDAVKFTAADFGLFKKFNNSVRREGYIFINPEVALKFGVGYGIVHVTGNANFKFDMDFQFTEIGTNAYGDIKIDLGWGIQLVGFEVYSKSMWDRTERLFNTQGQNQHIDFDYEVANTLSQPLLAGLMSAGEDDRLVLDKPVARDYLKNRGQWRADASVSLMSVEASEGTIETILQAGAADNPQMILTKINDEEILMVFVDDVPERNNVNKRGVYYSIGDGNYWSAPQLIKDDRTLDDYPNVYAMGNGKILVSWSSADKVFAEGATVEEALKALNIEAAFFDTATKTFGEVTQLTKTTAEDYTADVLPRAAYDGTTDRLILYYTKTEYADLAAPTDLAEAASVTAYLFYKNGQWSNDGSFYTPAELAGMSEAEQNAYKENWYGQRFLDTRIDSSAELLRVVDTAAICYNGLALFAWTVDWDKDLTTNDDRDVFMQIYNFSEQSFTHIIRVTAEAGAYTTPKFGRSNAATYLFYGEQAADAEHGAIKFLDISDIISNEKFTKVTNGATEYYTLEYAVPAETFEANGGDDTYTIPAGTARVQAETAAQSDNLTDYDVYVDAKGQLYLFWTEVADSSRQIMAAMFNGKDEDNGASYWSEPFILTAGGDNIYYSGIGAAVVDNLIYIGCGKAEYKDSASSQLVMVKHTPYAQAVVDALTADQSYPQPGDALELTATVANHGMLPEYDQITVTFTMNDEIIGTQTTADAIPGGGKLAVSVYADVPENTDRIAFKAYIDGTEPISLTLGAEAAVEINDSAVGHYAADAYTAERYAYTASAINRGNAESGEIVFTAYAAGAVVGTATLDALSAGQTAAVDMTLDLPDPVYNITDGIGSADITVEAIADETMLIRYDDRITKTFSAAAMEELAKVTAVTFANSGKYTLESGEVKYIQPLITGVEENTLKVEWQNSSDGSVAYIDYANAIIAEANGTATITGIIVPYESTISFDSSGNTQRADWNKLIPSDQLITVSIEVTVKSAPTSRSRSSSSAPVTIPEKDSEIITTTPPDTINFNDTASHWAKTYIERLAKAGIIKGIGNGQFDPDGNMTRAQAVQMLMNSGLIAGGENEAAVFTDVSPEAWYYQAVAWAVRTGIAHGLGNGMFAPDEKITREQLAVLVNNFMKLANITSDTAATTIFDDEEAIADWAKDAVRNLAAQGVVKGRDTGGFDPGADITRAESAVVICNILDLIKEE